MRRISAGGWAVALLAGWGLTGPAAGAKPDVSDTPPAAKAATSSGWWSWLGPSPKADKKSPAKADKKSPDEAAAKPAGKKDEAAEVRDRERAALLRRLSVIDQLRSIAAQKNDDTLRCQADELDARVWEVYNRRIAQLPFGKAEAGPVREAGPEADAQLGDSPIRVPSALNPPGSRGGRVPAGEGNR